MIVTLVSPENIPRIHLLLHILQTNIIPVCYYRMALLLELVQVIHHPATEETASVFQGRFVDDDFRTFCLDAFHHTLDGALAEVV